MPSRKPTMQSDLQDVLITVARIDDAIEAVKTDIAALQAIDIDTGWPS